MNILKTIAANKAREIELRRKIIPQSLLEHTQLYHRPTFSLADSLQSSEFGIIAEHKRRSPSKPIINQSLPVANVVKGYEKAKVSGISVLTDSTYFGGSIDDILLARASVSTPLLRKEFILGEYQIIESKSIGADAILLIACMLTPIQVRRFAALASSLGMESVLEVHNLEELEKSICPEVRIVGVNNRNLATFTTHIETSLQLSAHIPKEFVKISESGLNDAETVAYLKQAGYSGFLMGEHFMKTDDPGEAASRFIDELKLMMR